jgi:branched-chain amino acid transport system ATP-binding protein
MDRADMLTVDKINVFYGRVQILHDVSFQISKGEIITLLGGNGMGKTTTLKTLSGILRPKTGTIEFMGQRIDGLSPSTIVKLGLSQVPQERELFTQMTVSENLELGACVRNNKDEIKEDLERLYVHFPILKERKNRSAGTLSGGEQQMLAIARGLMARPKLLMFDEPSAGLAPIILGRIAKIIRRLHENGMTILLVEQNIQMALALSEHSYILRGGQIVFESATQALKDENIFRKYVA